MSQGGSYVQSLVENLKENNLIMNKLEHILESQQQGQLQPSQMYYPNMVQQFQNYPVQNTATPFMTNNIPFGIQYANQAYNPYILAPRI